MGLKKFVLMILVIGISTAACSASVPEATPTIKPSDTPFPTATNTIVPTDTSVPTITPTSTEEPDFELGSVQEVTAGGFSFQTFVGFEMEISGGNVGLVDPSGTIIISLNGVTTYSGNQSYEEIIDEFLLGIGDVGSGHIEKGEMSPIVIDGYEGISYDLTGTLFNDPIEGQTVLVMPSPNQFLFAIALANQSYQESAWADHGVLIFSTLLESISFIKSVETSGNVCEVSTDETYGYSMDNPIKVGGDWLDGPERERAYLDSLSGPNGETVSYQRVGSIPYRETILDEYLVTYSGVSVTLFLDEYSYEDLMAPFGFTCCTPIPLTAP